MKLRTKQSRHNRLTSNKDGHCWPRYTVSYYLIELHSMIRNTSNVLKSKWWLVVGNIIVWRLVRYYHYYCEFLILLFCLNHSENIFLGFELSTALCVSWIASISVIRDVIATKKDRSHLHILPIPANFVCLSDFVKFSWNS